MKSSYLAPAAFLALLGTLVATGFRTSSNAISSEDPGPSGQYVPIVVTTTSTGGDGFTPLSLYGLDGYVTYVSTSTPGAADAMGRRKSHPTRTATPSYVLSVGQSATFHVSWDTFQDAPKTVKWTAELVTGQQKQDLGTSGGGYIDLHWHPDLYSWDYHDGEVTLLKALDKNQFIFLAARIGGDDSYEDCDENKVAIYSAGSSPFGTMSRRASG